MPGARSVTEAGLTGACALVAGPGPFVLDETSATCCNCYCYSKRGEA